MFKSYFPRKTYRLIKTHTFKNHKNQLPRDMHEALNPSTMGKAKKKHTRKRNELSRPKKRDPTSTASSRKGVFASSSALSETATAVVPTAAILFPGATAIASGLAPSTSDTSASATASGIVPDNFWSDYGKWREENP